ncbi:hypothetical protein GCK32_016305 [Trichostrongylus colubriformis]|uniref:Uncharacterized protein n=1 Tax=Trichostrongylus colubriformis TaxID=6319 RepID=A0AAN8IZ70_TRICO
MQLDCVAHPTFASQAAAIISSYQKYQISISSFQLHGSTQILANWLNSLYILPV